MSGKGAKNLEIQPLILLDDLKAALSTEPSLPASSSSSSQPSLNNPNNPKNPVGGKIKSVHTHVSTSCVSNKKSFHCRLLDQALAETKEVFKEQKEMNNPRTRGGRKRLDLEMSLGM